MDEGLSRAVREVFVRLYEEGLISADDYLVNWCPRCQTALSDLEVEREERDGEFVYIKYGRLTLGHRAPGDHARRHRARRPPRATRATRSTSARNSVCRPSTDRSRIRVIADEAVDPTSAPVWSRSPRPTIRSTSRSACATTCPSRTVIDSTAR